jgi:hypothetical protein
MTYTFNYRWGDSADGDSFSTDELTALLSELDGPEDQEHGDVSVVDNDSGWIISVFAGERGLVVLESEEDEAFHMTRVDRQHALQILEKFVDGAINEVRQEPWLPGYG